MAVVAKESNLQILKKLVPLNLLPDETLEQLLKSAVFKKAGAGSYLFRQGDTDYHNFYLISGRVSLLDDTKEMDRIMAGSETARFPLAHQIPRKNSVRALGNVEYVLIDNRELSKLLVRAKDDDYKVADFDSSISDDWMAQLLQSNVFQQIPAANIQGVIMRMEEVEVKRGVKVIEQGGEGDYFYLMHQGRGAVTRKEGGKGKAIELAKLGPGDSFGEEALLSNSPRNSTVTMLSDGVLLRLAKEDFIEFVKRPLARGVNYSEAKALVSDGAIWLDVRPPDVYESGHMQGSVNFPLETLRYQASNLAQDRKYVICCDDGQISATAAYLLTDRGFNVSVLEGGLRTVPPRKLIKEEANKESSAKVISLRPGEDATEEKTVAESSTELGALKKKLAAANSRIKELGVKFQNFRDKQQKEESKQLAEIKAQKVIIDKNRTRLDEMKNRREADRRLIEQLQQETGDLNASLREVTDNLSQAKGNVVELETKLRHENDSKRSLAAGEDEHKKQLDKLASEKDALEEKLAELHKEGETVTQRQEQATLEAEKQISQLRAELERAQQETQKVQSELKGVQDRYQGVQVELTQVQEKHQAVQPELEEIQREHKTAKAELTQVQDKYHAVQTELIQVQDKYHATKSELKQLQERHQDTQDELEKAQQQHKESQPELVKLQEKHQAVQSELDQLQEKYQAAQSELKRVHEEHQATQPELKEIRWQHQTAKEELTQVQDKYNAAQSELIQIQDKYHAAKSEIKQLQERHQDAQDALTEARERHQAAQPELTKLQEKYQVAQSELDQLKEKYQTAQSELGQAQEKYKSTQAELAKVQEQHQATQPELQRVQKKHQETQSELGQVQEKYRSVRDELTQIQEKYLSSQTELDRVQDKFWATQSELAEVKEALQETREGLEHTQSTSASGESGEISALRAEIATLTEALTEADLAYDQIREKAEAIAEEKEQLLREMQKSAGDGAAAGGGSGGLYDDVVSHVFDQAEEETLRQELEELRQISQRLEQRANEADAKCASLENALEDRNKEIGQAKSELDEEKARLEQAEKMCQQREEEADQLRDLMAQAAALNSGDSAMRSPATPANDEPVVAAAPRSSSGGGKLLWGLLGAVISGALIGGGVLFLSQNGVSGSDEPTQIGPQLDGIFASDTRPMAQALDTGKRRANSGIERVVAQPGSPWSVLQEADFGPAMIRLSGASYIMGSNRNQVSGNEWPAHEVQIASFAISKSEVTFDEYSSFAIATGRDIPKDEGWGRKSRPVINVTWDDAVAYTEWLSQQTGAKYRLPTEAEWEFAVRGGSDATYWWGYQMEEGRENCFDCGTEWDRKSTAPVASFPPNSFGLHDMAGNVREWVEDCYRPNYEGAPADGSAWMETACKERVVRGGAYDKTGDSMRSSWRGHFKPDSTLTFVGFRVVREL